MCAKESASCGVLLGWIVLLWEGTMRDVVVVLLQWCCVTEVHAGMLQIVSQGLCVFVFVLQLCVVVQCAFGVCH